MRVLFTTQPAYGHFRPLVPLANALVVAGHEVAVATSAMFGAVISLSGLTPRPAGLDWLESDDTTLPKEAQAAPTTTLAEFFAHRFVATTAPPLARDVIDLAATWRPDLIVRERTEFGGALAADVLGIPYAVVQVASPSLYRADLVAAMAEPYNEARLALGLNTDEGLEALSRELVLSFAPPSLHDPDVPLPPNLVSLRPVGPDKDKGDLPEWAHELGSDRPAVYATLGTVFNNPDFELPFFPAVLQGLAAQEIDLVVTVGPNVEPASLGQQPPNVHVERYLPQRLLFPSCSVVICHGGFGTLLDAIESCVPVVVVPFGADQHINARSVERLRLGHVINEDQLTPDGARVAVMSLIADRSWRENVTRVRDEGRRLPGIDRAVAILEGLAVSGAPATSSPT